MSIEESTLIQLVDSYRYEEGQPRQRVVVTLGDARIPEAEISILDVFVWPI